jgi:hypothetical protein
MRLCREVENGVDLVLAKHTLYICWGRDVAILEREVGLAV